MELEPSSNIIPIHDAHAKMPEPPPVKLVAVDDVHVLAELGHETPLDRFYITLLRFELDSFNRSVYGSPRVHRALQALGDEVCENTVAQVMRDEGIRAKTRKKFVPRTTDSRHDQPVASNGLDRDFAAAKPDTKWAADITYVPTGEGWLYVAGVIDLCSRKIVGWSMADHMETDLVAQALKMALIQRCPEPGLLHHSDRGVQYASDAYQQILSKNEIEVSMSGKGDCWDNAVMESFWATLKTECVYLEEYASREEAKRSIFEFVEVFYNRKRLHSSLGYVSPESFEASLI